MFLINDDDMSIYLTRGDTALFQVSAMKSETDRYVFQPGDVVRIKVFEKKACENVVLQKDFGIEEETEMATIQLDERETKIGEVISKPKDYWYEIELNPFTEPQTIVGYDDDGAKVLKLFPEGADVPDIPIEEEDIPIVDAKLDLTSTRPVQNQAITRAILLERKRISEFLSNHEASEGGVYEEIVVYEEGNSKITAFSNGVHVIVDVDAEVSVNNSISASMVIIGKKLFKPISDGVFPETKTTGNGSVTIDYYKTVTTEFLTVDVVGQKETPSSVKCQFLYAVKNVSVSIPEIIDARIGADGTVYDSLGDSIRGQVKNGVAGGSVARIGEATLLADNWTGENNLYSQVVSIDGVTENTQVDLTPSVEQLAVFYEKDLAFVTENEDGVVTVYAIGQKPLNDYTIQVTMTEVAYE